MINNDLISTIVRGIETEQHNETDIESPYIELEIRKEMINQLKLARIANNLTQVQIAEKMKTQKQNISRLEKGQFDPKLGTLLKYADALGMRLSLSVTVK